MAEAVGAPPAEVLMRPRYTRAEAARIIAVSPATFRNWAHGYTYRTTEGVRTSPGLITLAPVGDRLFVPFIGLAEAYILNAFRQTGVSMQRIRPALEKIQREMGLDTALANRRLKTDGVEILYEYGQVAQAQGDTKTAKDVRELVVVRNGQRVFTEVVGGYLRTIVYEGDWVSALHLYRYEDVDVVVDPRVNYGKPTLASRGIQLDHLLARMRGGESARDLAWDYDLTEEEINALAPAQSPN